MLPEEGERLSKMSLKQEELDRFLKEEQEKCLQCKFKDICKVKKYRFRREQDAKYKMESR